MSPEERRAWARRIADKNRAARGDRAPLGERTRPLELDLEQPGPPPEPVNESHGKARAPLDLS